MTRNSGSGLLLGIVENGVPRSFAKKFTSLVDKVPHQLATLHALASDPHRNGLSPHIASADGCQLTVGLKNQTKGFPQVASGFGQSPALGVHTRDFLDIGDVPPVPLLNDRCEFALHFHPWLRF
jgi:hypothetical protein